MGSSPRGAESKVLIVNKQEQGEHEEQAQEGEVEEALGGDRRQGEEEECGAVQELQVREEGEEQKSDHQQTSYLSFFSTEIFSTQI